MLKQLIKKAQELETQILQENIERKEIKEDEMYKIYAEKIEEFTQLQKEMLMDVEDSTAELLEVKKKITEIFKEKKIENYDNCFAKFKEKKSVNNAKVLEVIGGDLDLYATLSTITQKSLKDFAKDNKDIKKAILGCIQTDSKELVGVTIKYS